MKRIHWILGSVLLAASLVLSGCGKGGGDQAASPPPYEVNGVKVDLPKLTEAFVNGTPQQQIALRDASSALRYGQYPTALMHVDKLVNDTSITDEKQKKLINQVIEQLKQVVAKTPPR